jgi:uncharacterized protein (DUF1684 family)
MMQLPMSSEHLDLADYRRRVFATYDTLRRDTRPGPMRAVTFRSAKDRLFGSHPQSPVPADERATFRGLAYWRYDADLAPRGRFEPDAAAPGTELPRSGEGSMGFRRIGRVAFEVDGAELALGVFWIEGYAGGIFIPFRDATSGTETYGGGRYLWDSIKGADLGSEGDEIVLDFNFAYHPSCVYDPRWSCPLAPPENRLALPIPAGERLTAPHE